jgi:hypothetical protein
LNNAQLRYTVTEQELLAVVEACKHFGQIICGYQIRNHTSHQNLNHNNTRHINLREQGAQIFPDSEFTPTFFHINGEDNTGADGLSWLPMVDKTPLKIANSIFAISSLDSKTNYMTFLLT